MIIKPRRDPAEIQSSSMADVTFILLIFFLLTTTMSTDMGINIVLPPVGDTIDIPKTNITEILVNQAGKVLMDDQLIAINQIKNEAIDRINRNDKMIFSVQTHPKTKYIDYIAVLDQLKLAKAQKISIANPTD